MAYLIQINVNPKGGVPKHPVPQTQVQIQGVVGDKQRYRRFHGGPTRAVSLYSYEHLQALQAEGHPITPGATGENLTIQGLDWPELQVGDQLQVGEQVCLEITSYAVPCKQITSCFIDGDFSRISQKRHPGWSRLYARVIREGLVAQGDLVQRIRVKGCTVQG
ncbi:MOSC domain-containing protein [Leptolyngbya sp. FACHB-261]|uniref:MOSC domain-containing protein n=1 Tax=Leptolyngbya sp. FACHB-261 TaxID=2692806 RepID=UPI001686DF62|nr:MOSC domain-containing protein [Leptolyngbya sp. FACHB-261]MBD2102030.1 MOSC domain-containing protein [Leptolyngbya sp. FACHB-261]